MARDTAYYRAEQKIEEARIARADDLDLRDMGLTELPKSLGRLTGLQYLNLSGNALEDLPKWLGQLTRLRWLNLASNCLAEIPESLSQNVELESLDFGHNRLTYLPEALGKLALLRSLNLFDNELTSLPDALRHLSALETLSIASNKFVRFPLCVCQCQNLVFLSITHNSISVIPAEIGQLQKLKHLAVGGTQVLRDFSPQGFLLRSVEYTYSEAMGFRPGNKVTELPSTMTQMECLSELALEHNPISPELAAAYQEGLSAVKRYLRAKSAAEISLNEAKLILIGEGEVGKSCLLGALRGDDWIEGKSTTHGIEIKPVVLTDPDSGTKIKLNGWDFGGQRVYRPTHQLFFSAPAVYLVVWKPREGPQQGFVNEWIKLVKHREPDAKILVVATHGGPGARQPDIDRQEIWDIFGKETVVDFFFVDSKSGLGIQELRESIARVAASLPEVGRTFPKSWQEAREKLKSTVDAYLPLEQVLAVCGQNNLEEADSRLLLRICHRIGDLIHYEHDPALCDIVVLKPNWLATAISYVLDDRETREVQHGLVTFERLSSLWNDPGRPVESRYEAGLHPLFIRLMERFDLSYKVAVPQEPEDALGFWQRVKTLLTDGNKTGKQVAYTSLVAQLVPDVRPAELPAWPAHAAAGDEQQIQVCRIVETANGQSAAAEGLFFQLIVRLHKFSLGRADFKDSVHWQRGLLLADDTGSHAFLEHIGNDVRITVRSPYPQRFLSALTYEVQWLVETFWKGMRCEVTVPCVTKLPGGEPCKGLFEVGRLLENKKRRRPEVPCAVCNEWHEIEILLNNAPASRPNPMAELLPNIVKVMAELNAIRKQLNAHQSLVIGRFDILDASSREIVSKVEDAYAGLMRTLLDEAKEGPRLFSFEAVEPGFWDRPKWMSTKFRITLWCEHSRMPLWFLTGGKERPGVYEVTIPRDWLIKAAPFLKLLTGTLALVVPVASAATKNVMDEAAYKAIENQLGLGEKCFESLLKGGEQVGGWSARDDGTDMEPGEGIEARGVVLRQLHAWLKEKDPGFGGLIRVQNKRQEFLWVHPQFEKEY